MVTNYIETNFYCQVLNKGRTKLENTFYQFAAFIYVYIKLFGRYKQIP